MTERPLPPVARRQDDGTRDGTAEHGDEFVFDADKIALALTYHLSEDKSRREIAPRRAATLYERVQPARLQMTVDRRVWAALTNEERLEILLEVAVAAGNKSSTSG